MPWGVAVFSEHAEGAECPSVGGELHVCSELVVVLRLAVVIDRGGVVPRKENTQFALYCGLGKRVL